jgi:hypothetical protein
VPLARSLLIALALVGVAVVPAASASGSLPLAPTGVGVSKAHKGLQVKPATIIYTGDGSGFLGGVAVGGKGSSIKWTKWTSTVAIGSGFNQINDCEPYCAAGKYHHYQVKIEMWRPRELAHTLVFTRLTIFYEKSRPPGEPSHYTFTDTYMSPGGYGWGPPDASGYCVKTHGLKPAAGCQNIHSLP